MTNSIDRQSPRAFRIASRSSALLLAVGLMLPPLHAQEREPITDPVADLKQDVEALKKGQAEIQRQLQEIRRLLQARPAAPAPRPSGPNVKGVVIDLGDGPSKGESTAPLTLVEFTDYQ